MDIEELKQYLRDPDPVYRTDDDNAMAEAADAIEFLQRENQLLRHEQLQLAAMHAEGIAALKRELEEARKDAEKWRAAVADAQKYGATTICSDERAKQITAARQQKDAP